MPTAYGTAPLGLTVLPYVTPPQEAEEESILNASYVLATPQFIAAKYVKPSVARNCCASLHAGERKLMSHEGT